MATSRASMTASEFYERLQRNELTSSASLTGMVRASERTNFFQLSVDSCETWIDIPVDAITEVELLGRQTCADHSHPIARISLKDAEESDPWQSHLLLSSLKLNGNRGGTVVTDISGNPCQDCVRSCYQFIGNAEAFRNCIVSCPC